MLTEVAATRYVTPLREGGSLPGLVEADDLRTYAMKFTGAGQGRKTLVAEVVCGRLARLLGFRVPRLVAMELDPVLGLGEPDEEVQALLKASGGLNLGVEYLPGALGFDSLAYGVAPREAGRIVWFDALVGNVDRSWRNPNLLVQGGDLWLIDHGATMIWHHNWPTAAAVSARPYDAGDHALAPFGPQVAAAAAELAPLITRELLTEAVAAVPGVWLDGEPGFGGPDEVRHAYADALLSRAATVHEHIAHGPPSAGGRPVGASGWLPAPPRTAGPETGKGPGPGSGPGSGPLAGTGAGA